MKTTQLTSASLEDALKLYVKCFSDNEYFIKLLPDSQTRSASMQEHLGDSMTYCLASGKSLGVYVDNQMIALCLACDFLASKHGGGYTRLFDGEDSEDPDTSRFIHLANDCIAQAGEDLFYIPAFAVLPEYRRRSIASEFLDSFMSHNIIVGISNVKTLPMYIARGFSLEMIAVDYYFGVRFCTINRHSLAERSTYAYTIFL